MSYFEFPHTRDYEGDLGYIIKAIDELVARYNNFFDYNSIKFNDPINWDINTQYTANTIVYVDSSKEFIISKKEVPSGINYDNNDYWLLVTPFKTDISLSVTSYNPIANKPVTERFSQLSEALAALKTDLQNETITRAETDTALNNAINAVSAGLNTESGERIADVTLLNNRINAIEALTPGSTTGDAELIDARIGYNGINYSSAGEAIRKQLSDIDNVLLDVIDKACFTTVASNAYSYVLFNVKAGETYKLVNKTPGVINAATFSAGDSSGSVVDTIQNNMGSGSTKFFTATADAPALRLLCLSAGPVTIENVNTKYNKVVTDIASLDNDIMASNRLIDVNDVTLGKYYEHETTTLYNSPSAAVLNYTIPIFKGCTYKFVDLYAYFCNIKYDDDTIEALSDSTATVKSGEFTAEKNGHLYITLSYINGEVKNGKIWNTSILPPDKLDVLTITPADDVIEMLLNNAGRDIYFSDGVYDIIEIYENHFGSDYFDNYSGYSSGGNNLGAGLPIYRGSKVTFSTGAKFTANYTGLNDNVRSNFSAFWLQSNVTFDGLRIEASGIRNIIHDDFDNNYSGTTIIKNCHFEHDHIIIAGGLALHDTVIIENNYFKSTSSLINFDFSYHNNAGSGAQSNMIIKDNYLEKGISIRYYGESTDITTVLASNNSMAYDIEYRPENSSALINNMSILKWNNVIR